MWSGVCKKSAKREKTSLTIFVHHQGKAHFIFKNKTLKTLRAAEPTGHCRLTSSLTSAYLRRDY